MNTPGLFQNQMMLSHAGYFRALLLMAALLTIVTPASADDPPTYLYEIDASAVPGGSFNPSAIAVDGSNNLFVADNDNSPIIKFADNGNYLTQWGSDGNGNGQFAGALFGVAFDSSNNVYVVDQSNSRIEKFDNNGNYLTQWGTTGSGNGQFYYPWSVTVDASNDVYVTDGGNSRIEKFDSNGNYLSQWGYGHLGDPIGIAMDSSNNFYVVDNAGNCIDKFNSDGSYLTRWGTAGSGNGQFNSPYGIAIDVSNNVYIADVSNYRIQKFDSNGKYLNQWGTLGSGKGQFELNWSVATDKTGNLVYVVDEDNGRVQVFVYNANIVPPIIRDEPASQIVPAGVNVTVNISVVGAAPFGYQWNSNGIAISGATNATFTLNTVSLADSAAYSVLVTNNFGMVLSGSADLAVVPAIVTNQPVSQTVIGGNDVTFNVGVVGTGPFIYQWTLNNLAVPGATNATLTLTNTSLADAGNYSVLASNNYGGVSSSNAVLTIVPSIVLTQPAGSLSDTGAVLNGSVTVGPNETVAWFEWGIDTNYGNIAGETAVFGNNGSNIISAVLTGLPGNIYHYRIDAANDFGIVYGDDQSFTVGFFPSVTTLAPMYSPNGVTLNATVNPNDWDATVYFKWGIAGGSLSNSTPSMDAGTGDAPLTVGSLITNLAPAKKYYYQLVASNFFGAVPGLEMAFYSPPFIAVRNENWDSVASSADGSVLVAVANNNPGLSITGGPIFISINSGVNWTLATGAPTNGLWETVACSADGSKMIAAGGGGGSQLFPIYTSLDTGTTWVSNNAPVFNWQSVASSADGTRLAAAAEFNRVIYTSTNSGAVWTQATNAPKVGWFSVALSADGTKLAAVANGSPNIFTSPDFGTTWITNNVPTGLPQGIQRNWSSIASSADGSKLIAATGGNGNSGFIFISTNSGAAWRLTATNIVSGLVAHPWIGVASSADGSKLAAVSDASNPTLGVVITSTNSGATWTTNAVPFLDWNAVTLSADGAELVASVGYPSTGPIYVSQTTPTPVLNLSAPDNVISWIIPSLNFTLQQSPDLSNWTNVANLPTLNLTNLQNQIVLPTTDGNNFFRLVH